MGRSLLLSAVLLATLFMPQLAQAQGSIQGTVVEQATGDPLPGVNVIVTDLGLGAATASDGTYLIGDVPAGTYVLEARFIGFQTRSKDIAVVDADTLTADFELGASSLNLDEVVVTGTGGPVEKKKLGNSIGTIDAKGVEEMPVASFSELLQGREPGMVSMPSSGVAGEGSRIRIRGSASLSQSNEPVVFVDGVRIDNGGGFGGSVAGDLGVGVNGGSPSRLDDINPAAIQRVEVLKGAAAATLYGTQASNGVIQIFTRTGRAGEPRFNFSIEQGFSSYPDVYDNMAGFAPLRNPATGRIIATDESYAQAAAMGEAYMGGAQVAPWQIVDEPNFMEELFETGYSQTYSASISGGAEGVTYFIGGRWMGEDGPFGAQDRDYPPGVSTLASDDVTRGQFTANVVAFPTDDFSLRATTHYTDFGLETFDNNNDIYSAPFLAVLSKPEWVNVVGYSTDETGSTSLNYGRNQTGAVSFATVNEGLQQTASQSAEHFLGSVNAHYTPLDMLALDATVGLDMTNQRSENVRPYGWNIDGKTSAETDGARRFTDRNNVQITVDTKLRLDNEFGGKYESSALVGFQSFLTREVVEGGAGVNFPPGFDVTSAGLNQTTAEFELEQVEVGVFGQEQLGYDGFLYLTFGGRLDAHSAFGSDFDAVFYPKVQGSFIPSEAPFWKEIEPLSSLRLRAAVGQSGLQPGAFDAQTTFTALSSELGPGVVPNNLGNADLRPEISTEWEVGMEIGLWGDRYALEGTYWDRTVTDALYARQFPVTGGFRSAQLVNIGELQARGFEIGIDGLLLDTDAWSATLFANAAYLWEQVTDLGGAPSLKVAGSYPRYRNFLVEGYAPGVHMGAKLLETSAGLLPFDTNGDGQPDTESQFRDYLDGLSVTTASVQELSSFVLLADENGDGNPLNNHYGKPTPDWSGSFGGSIGFEGFRLRTLFEFKAGNYWINNLTSAFRQSNPPAGRNLTATVETERDFITGGVDASYTPQDDTDVRYDAALDWVNNHLALAPYSGLNTFERGDFIRWRELSLTYEVPARFVQALGGRTLSITAAARNLRLWTRFSGIDPETNAIGRLSAGSSLDNNFLTGVEAFGIPLPRRYTFKLNFGF